MYSILGLHRNNGKENGNYYSILGLYRTMEKNTETTIVTIVCWGYVETMEKSKERNYYSILGNIGIMEKKMETTIVYWGNIGSME